MYIPLARKYRPQNFEEVVGQRETVEVLKKSIEKGKIGHAYLFTGPRGVGKTTIARIFAKALNCIEGPTVNPCNKCDICIEITNSSSPDVLEIDGASNRGIDEIRNIKENVNLMPSKSRFKIYIIDEVHMLTQEAFNALLKTLEEPPLHVKFFFATTAPEKILPTILSRCQRFNLKPLKLQEVEEKIIQVCEKEGIEIEIGTVKEIYQFCEGSLRDALSLLEQLTLYSDKKIREIDVRNLLGYPEEKIIEEILRNIRWKNYKETIEIFHNLILEGKDPILILEATIRKIKEIVLAKIQQEKNLSKIVKDFEELRIEKIFEGLTSIIEFKDRMRREREPFLMAEILILKLIELWGKEKISEVEKVDWQTIFDFSHEKIEKEVEEQKKEEIVKDINIEANWDKILKEIKKIKPTLEAALREGKIQKVEDEKIYLLFEKKYSFHKSIVEKPISKTQIEKIIFDLTGKNYKIITLLEENSKKSIIENEEVKKIINFFNGEIVQMEE